MRRIGDWKRATALIGNLGREMIIARQQFLARWGLKAEQLAVRHISKQDLGWAPLSASYLAQKVREGHSELILVQTSTYFQSITSWADDMTAYAGVKKDVKYGDDDTEVADIAATMEYGSEDGTIPARPLWKPVMQEMQAWAGKKENRPEGIFLKNIKMRYGV